MQELMQPWPQEGYEPAGHCPFCGSESASILYEGLGDITFSNTAGPFTMKLCGECGAGYLDPRPAPDYLGLAYRTYYTHSPKPHDDDGLRSIGQRLRRALANDYRNARYGTTFKPAALWAGRALLAVLPAERSILDTYYRYLPSTKGHLLDFGCGNGAFMRVASKELGWTVMGIDFDEKAAEAARKEGFEAKKGDEKSLLEYEQTFDAVTISHVIEHVYEPVTLLRNIHFALKPGGHLFIDTPNMEALSHRIFGKFWRGLEVPRHLGIPSWASLELVLKNAGFQNIERRPRLDMFKPMYRRSQALSRGENSESVDTQYLPGPPVAAVRELKENPDLTEYVTLTARKER